MGDVNNNLLDQETLELIQSEFADVQSGKTPSVDIKLTTEQLAQVVALPDANGLTSTAEGDVYTFTKPATSQETPVVEESKPADVVDTTTTADASTQTNATQDAGAEEQKPAVAEEAVAKTDGTVVEGNQEAVQSGNGGVANVEATVTTSAAPASDVTASSAPAATEPPVAASNTQTPAPQAAETPVASTETTQTASATVAQADAPAADAPAPDSVEAFLFEKFPEMKEIPAKVKSIIMRLEDYVRAMGNNTPMTPETGAQYHIKLLNIYNDAINAVQGEHRIALTAVLFYVKKHIDSAFREAMLMRFHNVMRVRNDVLVRFRRLNSLFTAVADPATRASALKKIDIEVVTKTLDSEKSALNLVDFLTNSK